MQPMAWLPSIKPATGGTACGDSPFLPEIGKAWLAKPQRGTGSGHVPMRGCGRGAGTRAQSDVPAAAAKLQPQPGQHFCHRSCRPLVARGGLLSSRMWAWPQQRRPLVAKSQPQRRQHFCQLFDFFPRSTSDSGVAGEGILLATGGKRGHVATDGGDHKRRRASAASTLRRPPPDLEPWRPNARDDVPALAQRFGADLLSVPNDWLGRQKAGALLQKQGLRLPVVGGKLRGFIPEEQIMFWEVYSGCSNATRAFWDSASGEHKTAGPPVDIVREARLGLPSWNVLLPCARQFLWAIMIVCTPMWVHCAPPCTFSSTFSC